MDHKPALHLASTLSNCVRCPLPFHSAVATKAFLLPPEQATSNPSSGLLRWRVPSAWNILPDLPSHGCLLILQASAKGPSLEERKALQVMGKSCLKILMWEKAKKKNWKATRVARIGRTKGKGKRFSLSTLESQTRNKDCDPGSTGEGQRQRRAHVTMYKCDTELVTALSNQGTFWKDFWRVSNSATGTGGKYLFSDSYPYCQELSPGY